MQDNKKDGSWCGFNSYDKSIVSELVKVDPVITAVRSEWVNHDWTEEQINEFCSEISECFSIT